MRTAVTALLVGVLGLVAGCGGGDGGDSTPTTLANAPRFEQGDPCTLISAEQVGAVFDAPVTVDATNAQSPLTTDCAYIVGDPAAPLGRLVVNIVFPALGVGEDADALSVVENDRANAQLAGPGVFNLDVGQAGFVQSSRSLVELVVNADLAVSLQWFAADAPPEGEPITDEVEADLTTLASDITRRLG